MPQIKKAILLALLATLTLLALSGCGSTRSENGVSIEGKRSYTPW